MRNIQVGVMGSCTDLNYKKKIEEAAERIGELVAEKGGVLLFGAEKDFDSLSTAASRGAKSKGGLVVGVTYNKGKNIVQKDVDVIIASGLERGGGRELALVLSCDVVIAINGGSGTLTELAIAYQADIPMVVLDKSGGWSEKLANTYFDSRERRKVNARGTPEEVVELAFELAKKYIERYG
jgi:uncharacterized protein (TIGR00725 family)